MELVVDEELVVVLKVLPVVVVVLYVELLVVDNVDSVL